MLVVTVQFTIRPEHRGTFDQAIRQQALNSLTLERTCRQFDVCVSDARPEEVFLYEVYDDEAAFEAHLRTPHFAEFDAATRDWIARKAVQTWTRVEG